MDLDSPPGSPSRSQAQEKTYGKKYPKRTDANGFDKDMVSRSLPPRRARAKAMDDHGICHYAVDTETETLAAKKAKTDKADVQARSAKSNAKSSTASRVSSATRAQAVPRLSRAAYEGSPDGEAAPSPSAAAYHDSRPPSAAGRSVPRVSRAAYLGDLDDEPPHARSNRAASQRSLSISQSVPAARKQSQRAAQQTSRRTSAGLISSDEELIIPGFGGDAEVEDAGEISEAEEGDEWDHLSPRQLEETFAQEVRGTYRSISIQVSSPPPQPPSPFAAVPVATATLAATIPVTATTLAATTVPVATTIFAGRSRPSRQHSRDQSDTRANRRDTGRRTVSHNHNSGHSRRGDCHRAASREDTRTKRADCDGNAQPARRARSDHATGHQRKSRAQLAYEQEQPSWLPSDAEDPGPDPQQEPSSRLPRSRSRSASVRPQRNGMSDTEDHDDQFDNAPSWPTCTRIVLPQGREAFQLTAQSPDIQALLRKSIKTVEYHIAFIHAFPEPKMKTEFVRQQLLKCAKDLGLREVARRIRRDVKYVDMLASVPNQRVSNIRGVFRQLIAAQIVVNYGLDRGDPDRTMRRVQMLLRDHQYIFPGDVELDCSKPYEHPLIVEAISAGFFKHRQSVGYVHQDELVSSLPDEYPDEPELPDCMVAAAATCVHASLHEWESGYHASIKFSAVSYANVFDEHMTILGSIRKEKPLNYHQIMSRLLKLVRNGKTQSHEASVSNTLRLIKFS
ncbi:hypothetical protein EVJ58_g9557 [Rhodofomes roseus]|uniref:DUF6532 domain-containing protein n=1 Tax=Rhodofomes roseus TaxID=34475 RepID=A0A4Y9XTZ9_9APHY|nr:hypothetical protein EVJ58_g9557 [Rhodofomes roseus]